MEILHVVAGFAKMRLNTLGTLDCTQFDAKMIYMYMNKQFKATQKLFWLETSFERIRNS